MQRVGTALEAAPYNGQPSGRVREVPDARTIRYYTTLGILDRPLEMRGRTAYYGRRHLLQLVAIKRLQAQGMSLTEIQQRLTGASDKALRRWAALPEEFWQSTKPTAAKPSRIRRKAKGKQRFESLQESDTTGASGNSLEHRARDDFWAAQPARSTATASLPADAGVGACPAVVLSLGPGVALTITGDAARRVDAKKLTAIQPIVDQLLAELNRGD